jgi:hypothetical protein
MSALGSTSIVAFAALTPAELSWSASPESPSVAPAASVSAALPCSPPISAPAATWTVEASSSTSSASVEVVASCFARVAPWSTSITPSPAPAAVFALVAPAIVSCAPVCSNPDATEGSLPPPSVHGAVPLQLVATVLCSQPASMIVSGPATASPPAPVTVRAAPSSVIPAASTVATPPARSVTVTADCGPLMEPPLAVRLDVSSVLSSSVSTSAPRNVTLAATGSRCGG